MAAEFRLGYLCSLNELKKLTKTTKTRKGQFSFLKGKFAEMFDGVSLWSDRREETFAMIYDGYEPKRGCIGDLKELKELKLMLDGFQLVNKLDRSIVPIEPSGIKLDLIAVTQDGYLCDPEHEVSFHLGFHVNDIVRFVELLFADEYAGDPVLSAKRWSEHPQGDREQEGEAMFNVWAETKGLTYFDAFREVLVDKVDRVSQGQMDLWCTFIRSKCLLEDISYVVAFNGVQLDLGKNVFDQLVEWTNLNQKLIDNSAKFWVGQFECLDYGVVILD